MTKILKRHKDGQAFPVKEDGGKMHQGSAKIKSNDDEMMDFAKGKSDDFEKHKKRRFHSSNRCTTCKKQLPKNERRTMCKECSHDFIQNILEKNRD